MKLKSLLFGSAAVLAAGTGAQAADLPTVEPVEYVRICDAFGTGFFYIPGTDTCLKLSGYVRAESHFVAEDDEFIRKGVNPEEVNTYSTRVLGHVEWDARTQTDFGLIRAFIALEATRGPSSTTNNNGEGEAADPYSVNSDLADAFITVSNDWGTYTAGKRGSFFDYWGGDEYGTRIGLEEGTTDPNLFAWTFAGGNGFSFTISAEDPDSVGRRRNGDGRYEGMNFPDGVANIRVDQGWGGAQVMAMVGDVHDEDPFPPGDEHALRFAVGAGLKIGLPGGWTFNSQGGYAQGALAYISNDPGGLGDLDNGDANDQNTSWAARAGISGAIFQNVTVWAGGAFTHAEEDGANGSEYDWWGFYVGGAWEPAPGLKMGPEFAWNSYDFSDPNGFSPGAPRIDDDYDVWGLMWRVQRNF